MEITVEELPLVKKWKVATLKEYCHDYGLPVTRTTLKPAVVIEVLKHAGEKLGVDVTRYLDEMKQRQAKRELKRETGQGPRGSKKILGRLAELGVNDDIDAFSQCLLAGINKGHFSLDGADALDQVICADTCPVCCEDTMLKATLRDVLHQPDYAGLDYENGGQNGSVRCGKCGDGFYITQMCYGQARLDSGKFHNHCTKCKGFGKCIGDYREEHCETCGHHFFAGLTGFACDYCERREHLDDIAGIVGFF